MERMNKRAAQRSVERIFGPRAEAVRVSANDRSLRFHIYGGTDRVSMGNYSDYVPILLGTGDSWESAIDHARTTENGKLAMEEARKGQELAAKALRSQSPIEFANMVAEQAIKEALEAGANEAQIAAIKHKFELAKEKINEHESRAAEGAAGQDGQDSPDRPGDDGAGGEGQPVGELIL